ncbi:trypsin-like peptidase domain-containing protein [Kitasatospora sp. NPDC004531]
MTDRTRETELTALARRNVVAVRLGGEFAGSGFLLAPDLAASCAHVVAHAVDEVAVEVGGERYEAVSVACVPSDPGEGGYYAFPDLALIRLARPVPGRAGVLLAGRSPAEGAMVLALGHSTYTAEDGPAEDSLHLRVVGRSGPLLRVADDRVVPGMSGSLVLDPVGGRVCGMVKATRDRDEVQGGWIVPCEALAEHAAAWSAGAARHRPGTRWFDLAADRAALTRALFGAEDPASALPSPPEDPRPSWWLDTRNQVVPFAPRPELDGLLAWCEDPSRPAVRLVTGSGGTGKTRLAMRLCRTLGRRGWIAGFLPHGQATARAALAAAVGAGYRVLLVLDYAETRREELRTLLEGAAGFRDSVRILLLARSGGPWWTTVSTEFEQAADPEPVALSPLAEHLGTRQVVTEAWQAFHRAVLHRPAPELPARLAGFDAPDAGGSGRGGFSDVLTLHALALDEVLARREETPSTAPDPLRAVLGHEQRYWRRIGREHGLALALDDVRLRRTLLVPTLFAAADGEQAANALHTLIGLSAAPGAEAGPAARLLGRLYPHAERYWAPMQPDRLGETLLLDVVAETGTSEEAARLLGAVLSQCDAGQAEQALVVLGRAAYPFFRSAVTERTELLASALPVLVRQQTPWLGAAAVTTVLWRPPELQDAVASVVRRADTDLLEAMSARLSEARFADPEFKLLTRRELAQRLEAALPRRGWARSHPQDAVRLARVLDDLAASCEEVDEPEQALRATERQVELAGKLAGADPGRYRAGYARCLDVLALRLYNLGRLRPALRVCESAAREWAAVVRREAQYAPDLVDARLGVGRLHLETGNRRHALSEFRQATAVAVDLFHLDRPAHARRLALCLHLFSVQLSRAGLHREALEHAEACEAAASWFEPESPEELSTVADYLENFSRTLAAVGLTEEAIERKERCARARRQVVDAIAVPGSDYTVPGTLHILPTGLPAALESLVVTLYGLSLLLRRAQRHGEAARIDAEASRAHVRLADTPGPEGGNRAVLELTQDWMDRIASSDGFFRD